MKTITTFPWVPVWYLFKVKTKSYIMATSNPNPPNSRKFKAKLGISKQNPRKSSFLRWAKIRKPRKSVLKWHKNLMSFQSRQIYGPNFNAKANYLLPDKTSKLWCSTQIYFSCTAAETFKMIKSSTTCTHSIYKPYNGKSSSPSKAHLPLRTVSSSS